MKWCYFLRDGHIAGVRMLPSGLPDEDEIAKAHLLFSERKARFDAFEIWHCGRVVFSYPDRAAGARRADDIPERVAQAWITE
jgi:hypothetical protein